MRVVVPHTFLVPEITVPASKSFAQRAIIAAFLANGKSNISNIGLSQDVLCLLKAVEQLGARASMFEKDVTFWPNAEDIAITGPINCGESGLGVRLTIPIAATLGKKLTITGSGSLLERPMSEFEQILPQLGIQCETTNGFLPLNIANKLKGGEVHLDGALSSQFLSGLLMACPVAEGDTILRVTNLKSKPYVDMTLDVLSKFGIEVENREYKEFSIKGGQAYTATDLTIEGDWSGASIWAVYGVLKGIRLKGLNKNSIQSDKEILTALSLSGVSLEWKDDILEIPKCSVNAFEFDATHCPDLFPALVVLAAAANGPSFIKGVRRLAHKESNRALTLQSEFGKMGLKIELQDDLMVVLGIGELQAANTTSHNDHRIAMACAIAATLTKGDVEIDQAESVNKSYPEFWDHILA